MNDCHNQIYKEKCKTHFMNQFFFLTLQLVRTPTEQNDTNESSFASIFENTGHFIHNTL